MKFALICVFPQESELIESVEEEGKEDSAHSPVPEDKPKIQVSQQFSPGNIDQTLRAVTSPCASHPSLIITLHNLSLCHQNVIPQQLLDQYLSMTDPARAQTVDTEIAKHCAFSLPGVALTLGRQNWHCLKDTYETLATDVQVGRDRGNKKCIVGLVRCLRDENKLFFCSSGVH